MTITAAAHRILRRLPSSSWKNLGRIARQAQSDNDRKPYY